MFPPKIRATAKPSARADSRCSKAMGRAKRIIRRLGPFVKTAQPVFLRSYVIRSRRPVMYLVRLDMNGPNVPDQLSTWRIKHRMDRHGQFHTPRPAPKCPPSQLQPPLFRAHSSAHAARKSLSEKPLRGRWQVDSGPAAVGFVRQY